MSLSTTAFVAYHGTVGEIFPGEIAMCDFSDKIRWVERQFRHRDTVEATQNTQGTNALTHGGRTTERGHCRTEAA